MGKRYVSFLLAAGLAVTLASTGCATNWGSVFDGTGRAEALAKPAPAASITAVRALEVPGTAPIQFPFKNLQKSGSNPILTPEPASTNFESNGTFNPAVVLNGDKFMMLYRAQDRHAVSTVGLAESTDGIHFKKRPEPVIVPTDPSEKNGVEDPRVVNIDGTFYVTYTAWDGDHTPSCLASSKDLIHWEKHGQILPAKSTAILNVKVNGEYWAYFGDTNIWAAHSADLIHWTKVEQPVLQPRGGDWDDSLVESGPPPIMTKAGILLIYNGNLSQGRAEELGRQKGRGQEREYRTAWALFDKQDPTKLIARASEPFLNVTESWEVYGQVGDVVFTEGLVVKDGKAYLYYGGADTTVNVAIGTPAWEN